jgi:hypothetical protein
MCAVCAACGSGSEVHRAVPDPPGATVALTVDDGPRSWALIEDGDCVRLRIGARGRRYLSEPACPYAPFTSTLRVDGPKAVFNDRDVRVATCDDCAGPRPDVRMSASVVWGIAAPAVGFVCVDSESGPVAVKVERDGLVLGPVTGHSQYRMSNEALPFLPDGRFAGWESPGQERTIEACRAAGAPGGTPVASNSWPLRIELPRNLENWDLALSITTDTGYAPEGGSLRVIADGYRIPLRLHPDYPRASPMHSRGPSPAGGRPR